jgi:hypothetical protein
VSSGAAAYGVDVTVAELAPFCPEGPEGPLPPAVEVRPTRLDEMLPAASLTDAQLAREIDRCTQTEAVIAGYKAERIVQLASRRRAAADRQPGEPGHAAEPSALVALGVSEFFPDELAGIMNTSRTAATVLTETSLTLLTSLTATWEALSAGELDWPRARALVQELGPESRELEPAVVAAVEGAVLAEASDLSVRGVKAAARRELIARDPAVADRRRQVAERAADVELQPRSYGMSELRVFGPHPFIAAIRSTLDGYARLAKDAGDPRSLGYLRVAVMADLTLRPWEKGRPPVTGILTITAPLSAVQPIVTGPGEVAPTAEVDGQPITAGALRELLEQLDSLCPGGLQPPTDGALNVAIVDPVSGSLRATVTRPELERLARRGCPDHPDEACECAVLDRPTAVNRYRPSPAQRRFATTRDRTCRHPGCSNRAAWADLDHVLAHAAGGATDCCNLCCLCRRHHRLKTFAPGWSYVMDDDGVLTVTTPSGVTRVTRPPGMRAAERGSPGQPPAGWALDHWDGSPDERIDPPDDPAPF